MLGIDLIRDDPDKVRRALKVRGDSEDIDQILQLDERRRHVVHESDELRAHRNEVSRRIGVSKDKPAELVNEMRQVGRKIKNLEELTRKLEKNLQDLLLMLPNIPHPSVPVGGDENENVLIREPEGLPEFDFEPAPHWEIGENLDIIDLQRGAKLAGSRFYVLKDKGAIIQRALISWMLDTLGRVHGYREMYLPDMVTRSTAIGSGQLPKFIDNMYHDDEDDLWLVPTAEIPITGLYAGEIVDPAMLPFKYVAHTPCFRREKAAAGRDTRGIKRVHQFEKVEMYKFVEPETSNKDLESLIDNATEVCARLGLPYRVIQLCTADISFPSSKTFDIEVWASGSEEWLEVSSCSNCTDFQARRGGIRFRPEGGGRTRYPHTLNGSGLALPRVIISILENFQLEDGTVVIPDVLRDYTGFDHISPV